MPDQDQSSANEPTPLVGKTGYAMFGAVLTSLSIHLLLLIGLAALTIVLPGTVQDLSLVFEDLELPEEVEPLPQDFRSAPEPMDQFGALSTGGLESAQALASTQAESSLVKFVQDQLVPDGENLAKEIDQPIFDSPEVSDDLPVQGMSNVGVSGAVGAIDLLTDEILKSVEQQPTLVVWLFDQSGSLLEERTRILERFDSIYEQLGVIEAAKLEAFRKHKDKPLLTAVVGFAKSPKLLTKDPTDEVREIKKAVRSIEEDESGQENVFEAVAWTATKFRKYRGTSLGSRNVMIIVFTDEAGNDTSRLDETVHLCRKLAMPVYVVGRPAPFGRSEAYVKWIDPDPDYDQRPQWVPVSMGPESMAPERLRLQFFDTERREDLLDSGFGPYGLTRLCYETGGIYFSAHPNRRMGRLVSRRQTDNLAAHISKFFDPDIMRRYQPNYVASGEYMRMVRDNSARNALLEAAQLSWTTQMDDIQMRFVKRNEAELAEELTVAQRAAAIRQPQIDRICQILLRGEEGRDDLEQPRWQAGFDLALGRALATKVRTDGYNTMLAVAKQGMQFQRERNNTWILRTGRDYANSSLEKMAEKAEALLRGVKQEHDGTPWAYLADQELRAPLGWRWTEDYTFVPDPTQLANNNNNNRPRNRPRPQVRQRPPRRDPPAL